MSEMIERVAKAIYEATPRGDAEPSIEPPHAIYREVARAAIAAMREPTQAVLAHVPYTETAPPIVHWEHMIDAALKD